MNSLENMLNQHVLRAKNSKAYQEPPKYIRPKTNTEKLMEASRVYKKQVVDKPNHLEMEEKVQERKALKKPAGGSLSIGKPVQVKGSVPLYPINSEVQTTFGMGQPQSRAKARAEKVREVMKSKNLSLPEASKYIKNNNVKY